MPLPSTAFCLTGRPDACIIMSGSLCRQLGAPQACDWTSLIPWEWKGGKKNRGEGGGGGSLPASWERAPISPPGARSIHSMLAISAKHDYKPSVYCFFVLEYIRVSQGRCDGEEQSVPAPPRRTPPPPPIPHPPPPPPPSPLSCRSEKLRQLLSAWLTLNDLITCFRLEQL